MKKGPGIALALALLATMGAVTLYVVPVPPPAPAHDASVPEARTEASGASPVKSQPARIDASRPVVISAPLPAVAESERSTLADELHAPERTGAQDLQVVMTVFNRYEERFGGYPVGEDNAAFVHALLGHNPLRLAFLDSRHPGIDAQGQLLDRWGQPYFFHLLDRRELEVRSAGPDRKLYTVDDQVLASRRAVTPLNAETTLRGGAAVTSP